MHQKPKLLIAVDTYYPKTDGTLRFTEEFIKKASDTFEIEIIAPNFGEKRGNLKVTLLDISKIIVSSGYQSIKISRKNLKKIKAALKRNDLIFAQGPGLLSWFAVFYSRKYKQKCIGYMHVNPWEFYKRSLTTLPSKIIYWIIKPTIKKAANSCSLILVPYQGLVNLLRSKGISSTVKVARLGIDIEKFTPVKNDQEKKNYRKKLNLPENKTVIAYVGRISKEKNVQTLLEAFKKLKEQEKVFLLMIGDGPENQTKEFKVTNNCKITGFVDNVEDYLQVSDIFVMPSLTETTS